MTTSGPALPAFALWQGGLCACAPGMAWLNLRTELSARLQRRQRSEERRERLVSYQPHVAGATLVVLIAAGVALLTVGAAPATTHGGGGFDLPRRDPTDQGPLGNIGVLPGANPAPPATTTPPAGGTGTNTTPGRPGATPGAPGATTPGATTPAGTTPAGV